MGAVLGSCSDRIAANHESCLFFFFSNFSAHLFEKETLQMVNSVLVGPVMFLEYECLIEICSSQVKSSHCLILCSKVS